MARVFLRKIFDANTLKLILTFCFRTRKLSNQRTHHATRHQTPTLPILATTPLLTMIFVALWQSTPTPLVLMRNNAYAENWPRLPCATSAPILASVPRSAKFGPIRKLTLNCQSASRLRLSQSVYRKKSQSLFGRAILQCSKSRATWP